MARGRDNHRTKAGALSRSRAAARGAARRGTGSDRQRRQRGCADLLRFAVPQLGRVLFPQRGGAGPRPVPGQARLCADPNRHGGVRHRRRPSHNGNGPGCARFPGPHRLRSGFALRTRRAAHRGWQRLGRARSRQPAARAFRRTSPIYARGKYILVALIDALTFWLQSGVAGIGDRCRCGGLVGSGLGRRWRLKGSGRVQGQTPRLSGDEAR